MSPADALLAAVSRGVVLWLDGGTVRFRAPVGAVDVELRRHLAAARGAIVALLRAGACAPPTLEAWPPVLRDAFEERAGIMEFDGGLSREAAEREAERLIRLEHARTFVARHALVAVTPAAAVAGERLGSGPHR